MIADFEARQLALDPSRSFIVQAPAGSGKTGLLVYRILRLLARVTSPDQVLAITFTRKATSEMRERLIELLHLAEKKSSSTDAFEQQGIDLAAEVIKQSELHNWQLLDTPQQLQLLTIDAFCGKIAGDMPWLSRLGDRPRTTDQAETHYITAVDQLFSQLLQEPSELSNALKDVLFELDYNYPLAKKLFVGMLAKRDQWLRHFVQNDLASLRSVLEQSWSSLVEETLEQISVSIGPSLTSTLIEVAIAAQGFIEDKTSPLLSFDAQVLDGSCLPEAAGLSLDQWRGIAFLLTTKEVKAFRVQLNKKIGLPTDQKGHKALLKSVIDELRDDNALLKLLQQLAKLPEPKFSDSDWQQIFSLEKVLLGLAAHLQLRFRATGECDHSEVAQRANLALLEANAPTELALKIDRQIKHILVDEFQDTSRSQLELLQKLTAGWSPNLPDTSVFFVGDPMQSIYRFREADVGLFLQVANNKESNIFTNIDIEPITLSENFRSENGLVEWFNQCFTQSFPSRNQFDNGAVTYANSTSNKSGAGEVLFLPAAGKVQEGQQIAEYVHQELRTNTSPEFRIAILVRSRAHLPAILEQLDDRAISYSGVDIQSLKETPAIIDLVSLCKAICRLDDRVAWMALLRGPWCGLSLIEIQNLVGSRQDCIWDLLNSDHAMDNISKDSTLRLVRFCNVMREGLSQKQQVSLAELCRWVWQGLGGQDTLFGAQQEDIDDVLKVIAGLESAGDLPSLQALDQSLEQLYARPQLGTDTRVVVSTIHKAKGLQYDTVILPSLSNKSRATDKQLLMWTEISNNQGATDLLLAPIRLENQHGAHYDYLRYLEKQKAQNELIRVMYVACTRAERKVVLSAVLKENTKEELAFNFLKPESTSLLATVWEAVESGFTNKVDRSSFRDIGDSANEATGSDELNQSLLRLDDQYQAQFGPQFVWAGQAVVAPSADSEKSDAGIEQDHSTGLEFEWATDVATAVGVVLHQWLQYNDEILFQLSEESNGSLSSLWREELLKLGLGHDKLHFAVKRLNQAVQQMKGDENARFIFGQHEQAQNEFAINVYEKGELGRFRLDRTFIDQEGVRWIVDYKTTASNAENIDEFVDIQVRERHKAQLDNYGRLMRGLESREIRLAVYFPLLGKLRSWKYTG